ncbi:MAG: glutamine synthetase adenylyltransferase [Leptolinea sp.]|jgi:glutamate-ammonia-ligase adenylyltransferase|nr:glutamine synthetase adenylyltransferase [Leptolinea sp.]
MPDLDFESIPFVDHQAARAVLKRIQSRNPGFDGILPVFQSILATAADPDRSLVNFERFLECSGPSLISLLKENPRVIEILVILFSASHFLTEILLRNPRSITLLLDRQELTRRKTIEQIQQEAEAFVRQQKTDLEKKDALRQYQQNELLRIGASDFLDLYDLLAVVSQISRTAIALIRICLNMAVTQTNIPANGFVVLAMGKLGGRELNYSSDIDLVFLCRDDPNRYIPLAQKLIDNLASTTANGFLYRVDLRLRPWGNDGPLVTTVEGFKHYLQSAARLWEKQALLKMRPIAGDLALGEEFRDSSFVFIINQPQEEIRSEVFAMKQRTEEILREKGREWGEVKLGAGSIRDIEFVIQYLQLVNLQRFPQIRTRATLKAIPLLRAAGLLPSGDARILHDGYIFLRTIEHYLQMMDYRQTYTLPTDQSAINILARRLGFSSGQTFIERYQEHCKAVRQIFLHTVGGEPSNPEEASPLVYQHISRMDTSYIEVFSPDEIQKHAELAQKIDEQHPVLVDVVNLDAITWRVTIVAFDYPGELSVICGLLFVHGFNILDGYAFTYEPVLSSAMEKAGSEEKQILSGGENRPKIVDVFTVKSVEPGKTDQSMWDGYIADLNLMLEKFQTGQRREARGQLAKQVGAAYHAVPGKLGPLLPIEIEIDNSLSRRYTVLRIDAPDTFGFLYEFTNALAFTRTYINRMVVRTIGNRAQDIFFVNDGNGNKIEDMEKQRELRAAIVLIKHFTHLLPNSPNPEIALLHFREFLAHLFQRPNWPDEITSIEQSDVLKALAHILGVSDFLWDDFLRMQYANLFPVVKDVGALAVAKPMLELNNEMLQAVETRVVAGIGYPDWRAALNAYKDRELFRIDMRHILGLTAEFWDFACELTDLAEVVISSALKLCMQELVERYGTPLMEDQRPAPISIVALGKCGGRELGFASDIELMFIYDGKGFTDGTEKIETGDFFEKLVRSIVSTIHARQEGIFQIDLQLRPYGKAGSMAVSLEAFKRYFTPEGPAWAYERQALVKLRPIAGDPSLGDTICRLRDEYTYGSGKFDITAMRAMRERQIRHLVTGGTFNAKYSPGGLVDIEYLIQGLQINHGAQNPSLRVTNIRQAMALLHENGILSDNDYTQLRKAHTFLRWLIDSLRVVRGNAKDITVPPYGSEEFSFLARRLRYENNIDRLRNDLLTYQTAVQEINSRLLE